MTWKTRKFREISEIFARFAILTKFLSIEFLQTWQLLKNIWRHNFWVSFVKFLRAYLKIWLGKQGNIVKSAKFLPDLQFLPSFFDRISPNLAIIKNIWRHNFWVSFVKFLLANLKIWLGKQGNFVKSAKFFARFAILTKFLSIEFLQTWQLLKNIWRHNFWVSFVKFLRAYLKIWLGKQGNIVKSAKFLPDLQFLPSLHVEFHKTHAKVVSYGVFDICQVWRNSIDKNLVKIANLAKISLISRYFIVFQVISSDWHVEISQNSPKVVSYGVFDNCQVWRNSIDKNLVKIANLAKFRWFHDISLCFKSYLQIGT